MLAPAVSITGICFFSFVFLFVGIQLNPIETVANEKGVKMYRLRKINGITGVLHLASSIALVWLTYSSSAWRAPVTYTQSEWKYSAENQTSCGDEDKCWYEIGLKFSALDLDIATISALFGVISGFGHIWSSVYADGALSAAESGFSVVRWADYFGSASLMIVVLGTICGVTDGYTLGLTAMLQAALLLSAGLCEFLIVQGEQTIGFVGAVISSVLYLGLWTPAFGTIGLSQSGGSGTAKPPDFVWVVIFALFAIFSSFAVVYFYYLWYLGNRFPTTMELRYIALSLTAKIALHWTLYISTISRDGMLFKTEEEAIAARGQKTGNEIVRDVGITAGGIILAGILFAIAITKYYFRPVQLSRPCFFTNGAYISGGVIMLQS